MTRETSGRWDASRICAWFDRRPWLCGFNYVPSTAVNTTEFWQAETFDPVTVRRELTWGAATGFNTCRVFIQELVWEHDPEGLKTRLADFLSIAGECGLAVMPVLFDDCAFNKATPSLGRQPDPLPGRMMTSWTASPGHARVTDATTWPMLERYVTDLLARFATDERIVAWDLYNEPGNEGMGLAGLPLVEAAFAWARSTGVTQPLTAGAWRYDESFVPLNDVLVRLSDVPSFHTYGDAAETRRLIAALRQNDRPLLCTEYMARPLNSRFQTHLPLFRELGVGCWCWGLVNGRTQTHFGWDTVRERIDQSEWFHDLFHSDGQPYNPQEVGFIQRFIREHR